MSQDWGPHFMHLENLKFWHWTIIGILAGVLFGGVKLTQGPWFDVEGLETMDQPTFDREVAGLLVGNRSDRRLIQAFHENQPMLKNLVIHPPVDGEPTHSYWITGKYYRVYEDNAKPGDASTPIVNREDWIPFKYRAAVPYRSRAAAPGSYPTVVQFLAAVEKQYPNAAVPSRFAWWEQSMPTMLLPAGAGLLIIGIAWPLTLMLMQGAGLARAPSPASKLPKQRNLSGAAKAPKDHSADDRKLAELNAQMDKALSGFGASSASPVSEDSAAAAKISSPTVLPGVAAAPAAPPSKEEISRQYGGVFYPVVKKATPKKKE
jgi:hypothetical protein